jgi:hypothetical protein
LLLSILACVVAVDQTVTIEEPVDRIVVDVSAGDVKVVARDNDDVRLSGAFGGAGHGPIDYDVTSGVLTIHYDCDLCGGELKIEAPPEVELELELGAGDLSVVDMAGRTDADLRIGQVGVSYVLAPESIDIVLGTGDIDIQVPAGAYSLDLDADRGSIDVDDDVTDDDGSAFRIAAAVTNGSIDVRPVR